MEKQFAGLQVEYLPIGELSPDPRATPARIRGARSA